MSNTCRAPEIDPAICRAMQRFLDAAERTAAAAREMERARLDLDRVAERVPLRIFSEEDMQRE